ncbi:MAG: hypothetical protein ACR2P6_06695 [Gammaproteobacteria bacterium]
MGDDVRPLANNDPKSDPENDHDLAARRKFALTLAKLIADLALDPHHYFELHYSGRLESAQSAAEIATVVAELIEWVVGASMSDEERARLDRELTSRQLPAIEDLKHQYLA